MCVDIIYEHEGATDDNLQTSSQHHAIPVIKADHEQSIGPPAIHATHIRPLAMVYVKKSYMSTLDNPSDKDLSNPAHRSKRPSRHDLLTQTEEVTRSFSESGCSAACL